jgi:hypothetical protein
MSYLQEKADELVALISAGKQDDESDEEFIGRVKQEIKDRLLTSYRNGEKAGAKAVANGENPESLVKKSFFRGKK